ncbi:hypothetical protein M153_7820001866 [Pseudoloma neurophilia]|uniref:Uncharacterized protein n=1 Tax=Pseudoloma neurophilia TaxID=146866 RepID=A0A0R0M565_9MICR|nr:hypothetical protein M153_7820001866 [Pseudoloma neurophilia]
MSLAKILTFSLLDRCKLYNINPKDCQNSVYIPDASYDAYLKSFNIPIQKDPECNDKNCVIVVYKDPARISVNTAPPQENKGCNLPNAADCVPNINSNGKPDNKTEKEPPIVVQKTVYIDSDKSNKRESSDNDHESSSKREKIVTVTETVTESLPSRPKKVKRPKKESTSSESEGPTSKEREKEPCTESSKAKHSEIPKTVTISVDNSSQSQNQTMSPQQIVTVYEQPQKTVTISANQTQSVRQPEAIQTGQIQQPTVSPVQVLTDKSITRDNLTPEKGIQSQLEEMKTILEQRICKEKDDEDCAPRKKDKLEKCIEDCEEEFGDKKKKKPSKKTNSDSNESEEHMKKPIKTKTVQPVVTLTRMQTVTVTDEVPVTLYREIEKTITKDNIVTRFKVQTEYKTVSVEKKPEKISKEPVSPTVSIPITEKPPTESITPTATVTKTEKPPNETVTSEVKVPKAEEPVEKPPKIKIEPTVEVTKLSNKNEPTVKRKELDGDDKESEPIPENILRQYLQRLLGSVNKSTTNETLKEPLLISLPQIPLTSKDDKDQKSSDDQQTISIPITIADPQKEQLSQITPEKNEPGNELSKSLIPLFGQFLSKITKDSLQKVKKEDVEPIQKPDIKTVLLTTTQFVTETIRQPIETCAVDNSDKKEQNCKIEQVPKGPKTVYHTVYKKKPMKMKCRPVIKNKVNCIMIKEGTVFKTVRDGKVDKENSVALAKEAALNAVEEAIKNQNGENVLEPTSDEKS